MLNRYCYITYMCEIFKGTLGLYMKNYCFQPLLGGILLIFQRLYYFSFYLSIILIPFAIYYCPLAHNHHAPLFWFGQAANPSLISTSVLIFICVWVVHMPSSLPAAQRFLSHLRNKCPRVPPLRDSLCILSFAQRIVLIFLKTPSK